MELNGFVSIYLQVSLKFEGPFRNNYDNTFEY